MCNELITIFLRLYLSVLMMYKNVIGYVMCKVGWFFNRGKVKVLRWSDNVSWRDSNHVIVWKGEKEIEVYNLILLIYY